MPGKHPNGLGVADLPTADLAQVVSLGHIQFESEDARLLDRVDGSHVQREFVRFEIGLDQRVGHNSWLNLLDVKSQLKGYGCIAVGEVPLCVAERFRQFRGVNLEQAGGLGCFGPKSGGHLHDNQPLLPLDARGSDHRHANLALRLIAGELLEFDGNLLRSLGGLV